MRTRSTKSLAAALSPTTIGALYLWALLIIIFTAMNPGVFASYATVKQILNEYAIQSIVALGLLVPLAAGLYDLSIGAVVGLSAITGAWFMAHVSTNPILVLLVGLAVALAVGVLNILVVLVMRVDSFIGTLATQSIAGALVLGISGDNTIAINSTGSFSEWLGIKNLWGLTLPVALMIAFILILGFVLEKTTTGRHLYATGFDREVARLGGIRVDRLRAYSLVFSALLAGLAGVLETAALGSGDPSVGPSYLLPAFAATFLGATQFRHGRFNPWGTGVAVLLLGTGAVGLTVVGAPTWTPDIFEGVVLFVAVALTSLSGGLNPLTSLRRRLRRPVGQTVPAV
jgi:ribose transport system permease protein